MAHKVTIWEGDEHGNIDPSTEMNGTFETVSEIIAEEEAKEPENKPSESVVKLHEVLPTIFNRKGEVRRNGKKKPLNAEMMKAMMKRATYWEGRITDLFGENKTQSVLISIDTPAGYIVPRAEILKSIKEKGLILDLLLNNWEIINL